MSALQAVGDHHMSAFLKQLTVSTMSDGLTMARFRITGS
jgi:hypothetical protein